MSSEDTQLPNNSYERTCEGMEKEIFVKPSEKKQDLCILQRL